MLQLPEYPWEQLAPYRKIAAQHPDGVCDLSIGAPADPTPQPIQHALATAANAHGYPPSQGTDDVRQAIADWYGRRRNVAGLGIDNVTLTVGSKEFIAWLPLLLGLGPDDIVIRPTVAYPTYDIGAQLAGATSLPADSLADLDEATLSRVKLVWINSPANPTGAVTDTDTMAETVRIARKIGAVVASDECYAELGWGRWETQTVPSILDPAVTNGELTGLLSVYSLSKQSNMAGYRAAFAAGDPELMSGLINARKHAGMVVPAPVQAAMITALNDDAHVTEQKDRYRARREKLIDGLTQSGLEIHDSEAGLYLWVTDPTAEKTEQASWDLVDRFARAGILVGPGVFYSTAGNGFIRLSITALDATIDQAHRRLVTGL